MKKNKTKQLKEKEPNITTTNFDFVVELEYKTQMAMASLWLIIMSNEQREVLLFGRCTNHGISAHQSPNDTSGIQEKCKYLK
jgi:tRNA U34 5-methylaminomethyl-2-thiouridine-forming methyltransferase MnmC